MLACVVALAGCAGGRPAPVKDHSHGVAQPTHRVVRSGDTLYSIAWDVGLDFQTLARWNGARLAPTLTVEDDRGRLAVGSLLRDRRSSGSAGHRRRCRFGL